MAFEDQPEEGLELRVQYDGIRPAYRMNKTNCNYLYLNQLDDTFVHELITRSFHIVAGKRLK